MNPIKNLEVQIANAKSIKDLMKIEVVAERYIANSEAFGNKNAKERFERDAFALIEIVNSKPDLLDCEPMSMFAGLIKTAAHNIPLSSGKWSVYFRNAKQRDGSYKKVLVCDLDAHGKKEYLENQDNIKRVDPGVVVFKGDTFKYDPINKKVTQHEQIFPIPKAAPDNVIAAYCTIHFSDGHSEQVVLSVAEIEIAKSKSPSKDKAVWINHYGEMCKKTTYNRAYKDHRRTPKNVVEYKQYNTEETHDTTAEVVSSSSIASDVEFSQPEEVQHDEGPAQETNDPPKENKASRRSRPSQEEDFTA